MRTHPKIDSNQREIVTALRKIGATVTITSSIGGGFPDLVVGYRGVTTCLEVKSPGGRMTADEAAWFESWHGSAYIVSSVNEAVNTTVALIAGLREPATPEAQS